MEKAITGRRAIPLGCSLDNLLGGGIPTGVISEFYGPPGVGKSNIAIQATVNAIKANGRVAYIDPEGSFHFERVEQIAGSKYDKVLERTVLLEPKSLQEQGEMITNVVGRDFSLIVADPVTYHYRLELDRTDPFPINQILTKQLALLAWHAREKNAAVLVTNQVYSDFRGRYEPLAREVLGYSAKVIVELSRSGDARIGRLVKHPFRKEGTARFRIIGSGLV